uniref:Uncharacterized protein n=1 Tax=Nicotiana tabacum TaxID=4097 RepID=A0A1S4A3S8_TOBAC|nr:PREDICTED: uncharacterized protein LOC107793429 [Nicotiana tabacum]
MVFEGPILPYEWVDRRGKGFQSTDKFVTDRRLIMVGTTNPCRTKKRQEPAPAPESGEVSQEGEASESYQVTRYFQVPEETDATKSTAEELEQVVLFEKFLERKFHLGIGLHPELRAETRYPHLEKLALALVVTARKLRPYLQCHPIVVVTTFPLWNILHIPELLGRLAKWAVEMSEFDRVYKSRTEIKSHVLADFVANFSLRLLTLATKEAVMVSESTSPVWALFTDGSYNVCGIFKTKEQRMQQYVVKVQALLARFWEWSITHILREENAQADALANLGSSTEMKGSNSETVVQLMHSVLEVNSYYEVNMTNLGWEWRNEIINYLEQGKFLEDSKASRALQAKAARYSFKRGQLYRKSFQGPLARCLGKILLAPNGTRCQSFHAKCDKCQSCAPLWVEAGPYQKIDERKVVDFLWENIICRITYLPYHPSANGQAKSTNKAITQNLKKSLEATKGKWPEELPGVLWAYRTMTKSSRGETPFFPCVWRRSLNPGRSRGAYLEMFPGKLGPTWEDPYWVSAVTEKGSYELENQDREKLPCNWNVAHLKRYYF